MNISELGTVFGIATVLVGSTATGAKFYADHTYVTVAAQNQALVWDIEDEISEIERRVEDGTATQQDRTRLAILKERLRHLAQ